MEAIHRSNPKGKVRCWRAPDVYLEIRSWRNSGRLCVERELVKCRKCLELEGYIVTALAELKCVSSDVQTLAASCPGFACHAPSFLLNYVRPSFLSQGLCVAESIPRQGRGVKYEQCRYHPSARAAELRQRRLAAIHLFRLF